jgi:hypothetical protein
VLDAAGLSQKPGSNNSAAESFRKAPAWSILFDNGIHCGSLAQILGGKCYNRRDCLPAIAVSVLRLLDPNSRFGLDRIHIVQSGSPQEFW